MATLQIQPTLRTFLPRSLGGVPDTLFRMIHIVKSGNQTISRIICIFSFYFVCQLCQLDATGVDYIFIRFDAEISDVQARANRLGQDFMKFSNIFEKFLEFCVSGTKRVQSIDNGSNCFSEDNGGTLDAGEEFKLPETEVVESAVVPVHVKNEVDDTTVLKEHLTLNEDEIGIRKRRGRPKGSKNESRLKVEENEEYDLFKVDIVSTLDDVKQEDCFVERKEDTGGARKKQKRRSERSVRNGIISEPSQLNSESEKTHKCCKPTKGKKGELKLKEENFIEAEKAMLMKSEPRLKAEELKSKHLYACCECPKSFRTSLHLIVHYFLHFPSTRHFWCFSCTICDKRFRGNYCWNNVHFRLHTDESFKLFPCPKCQRSFETAEEFARHVPTHKKGPVLETWSNSRRGSSVTLAQSRSNPSRVLRGTWTCIKTRKLPCSTCVTCVGIDQKMAHWWKDTCDRTWRRLFPAPRAAECTPQWRMSHDMCSAFTSRRTHLLRPVRQDRRMYHSPEAPHARDAFRRWENMRMHRVWKKIHNQLVPQEAFERDSWHDLPVPMSSLSVRLQHCGSVGAAWRHLSEQTFPGGRPHVQPMRENVRKTMPFKRTSKENTSDISAYHRSSNSRFSSTKKPTDTWRSHRQWFQISLDSTTAVSCLFRTS